ncbi:LacI family DNA-binding transcriptional regulator [Bacillus testis]|uniref:LacI family DNA-binding transcriptional regulator n=1 Tax=Bacillus testis TaxID=1622072 RepID=UPI00067E9436|nr:LacI family DNA-binding transcriptional regulator [Bacillus testis]
MNARRVTIKDVALKANVSKATVSYVLNDVDKVSEETKQRVLNAIEELGYVPSTTARALAKNTSKPIEEKQKTPMKETLPFYPDFIDSFIQNKVGKVPSEIKNKMVRTIGEWGYIPSNVLNQIIEPRKTVIAVFMEMDRDLRYSIQQENPFYQEFLASVERAVQEFNLGIRVYNTNDFNQYEDIFISHDFLGVIVIGKLPVHLSLKLMQMELPVVVVDEYQYNKAFITITSDDKRGAFDSIEYLILRGHKKIAFVGCGEEMGNFIDKRIAGYKEALEAYRLPVSNNHIYLSEVAYSYEEGIRIASRIAAAPYTYDAVFCTSDIMAIGLMKGLMKLGYRVPEDISIMGFDNIQFSKYSNPELTTVDQNIFLKAETAVTLIRRKAKGDHVKEEYILPVSIVERESVSNRTNQERQ